jgi:hypothetical protein
MVEKKGVGKFDIAVLHRLARPDKVEMYAVAIGPKIHRHARELATVAPHEALGRKSLEEGSESDRGSVATEIRFAGPWPAVGLLS